jgi:hypothetical protein
MITCRPFAAAVTCAAVVSLAACTKPAPTSEGAAEPAATTAAEPAATPSSNALPHACDLLTAKDAEDVLGPGATVTRDSEDTCDLVTPSAPLGPTLSIKIEELTDTWDGGDTMMAMDKNVRKLPDIGEGGYTYAGGSIAFKKGKAEVSVIMSNYKGPLSKFDAAKLIATRVAAKM